jgi:hypothetical protein
VFISFFYIGIVSTIAGTAGKRGFADGVGKVARFEIPKGVWYSEKHKSLFVCDYGNDKLRMVNVNDGMFVCIRFLSIFSFCPSYAFSFSLRMDSESCTI